MSVDLFVQLPVNRMPERAFLHMATPTLTANAGPSGRVVCVTIVFRDDIAKACSRVQCSECSACS